MEEKLKNQELFTIMRVTIDRDRRRMLFHLHDTHEGCDKIAFDLNEAPDLKQIIQGLVNPPRPFTFTIAERLGEGICKIDSVDFGPT